MAKNFSLQEDIKGAIIEIIIAAELSPSPDL
jgi:hypothetical protein